jgi:hypothetical protein
MANDTTQPADSAPVKPSRNLTDRVKERVAKAGLALDRNPPRAKNGKSPRAASKRLGTVSGSPAGAEEQRTARSLRRVYSEMRGTYQEYRRQTGSAAVPELRDAVRAFKRGPSLTSLVGVAVFLEDRNLLPW